MVRNTVAADSSGESTDDAGTARDVVASTAAAAAAAAKRGRSGFMPEISAVLIGYLESCALSAIWSAVNSQ